MKQLENDYSFVMEELNSNVEGYKKEKALAREEERKNLERLSQKELIQLRAKCSKKVLGKTMVTVREEEMLVAVMDGSRCGYKQLVWELTGNISTRAIMKNYYEVCREKPILRTNYMYKNLSHGVKVVYAPTEEVFPVLDLQTLSYKQQQFLIENVIAAEARREYNPEEDSVLKLQGFLIEPGRMVVLASFYPYAYVYTDVQAILYQIFAGMSVGRGRKYVAVEQHELKKMKEKLHEQCLSYWKNKISAFGKVLSVPGELKQHTGNSSKGSVYKVLEEELVRHMEEYCKEHAVSKKTLLLAAWAVLLGRYASESNPVLCVTGTEDGIHLYPVQSDRNLKQIDMLHSIEKQLEEGKRYSSCTTAELEKLYGVKFAQWFHMIHKFLEFKEADRMSDSVETVDFSEGRNSIAGIRVQVNYHLFGEETGINYIYQNNCFYDVTIDRLHAVYVQIIKQMLMKGQIHFEKESFIGVTDTDEEKLHKLQVAQKALYIQKTGLFDVRSVEELMWLAGQAHQQRYSVGDTVLEEKRAVLRFGIVASGHLEQSRMDRDGMVRTLRMLKAGDVFGIETLIEDNISKVTYSVADHEATIVWIDGHVMIEFLNQCPDNWRRIMGRMMEEIEKFRKLWMIV